MKAEVAVSIETPMLDMRPTQNQIALQKKPYHSKAAWIQKMCREVKLRDLGAFQID